MSSVAGAVVVGAAVVVLGLGAATVVVALAVVVSATVVMVVGRLVGGSPAPAESAGSPDEHAARVAAIIATPRIFRPLVSIRAFFQYWPSDPACWLA